MYIYKVKQKKSKRQTIYFGKPISYAKACDEKVVYTSTILYQALITTSIRKSRFNSWVSKT